MLEFFSRPKPKKGFTLMELLIVISIFVLLATIATYGIMTARKGAKDTKVITAVGNAQGVAEVIYSARQDYSTLCSGGRLSTAREDLSNIRDEITGQGSSETCYATTDKYCISAYLISDNKIHYCVDYEGTATTTETTGSTDPPCDSTNYDC